MKQVKSTFGKALYSLLNDFSGRGPIPPSQYPRENMVFDEKLGIHLNFELHQRLYIASTMPPPPMPLSKSRSRKNRRGSGRGRYPPPSSTITSDSYPIQQFITEDGQLCYVANVVDGHNVSFIINESITNFLKYEYIIIITNIIIIYYQDGIRSSIRNANDG